MLVDGKNIEKVLTKHNFKIEDWEFLETIMQVEGWNGTLKDLDRILKRVVERYKV